MAFWFSISYENADLHGGNAVYTQNAVALKKTAKMLVNRLIFILCNVKT